MPQIPYKESEIIAIPTSQAAANFPVPNSQNYLGFAIQLIDAKCDTGANPVVDGGFRIEVNLGGTDSNGAAAWALLYSADFYAPADPHFHQGEAVTFSLRAPAKGGIRIVSKSAVTTSGKAVVSMYERAYPPQV
jgi:hypothetical protein